MLQYISQGKTAAEHLKNIERACQAGVKWVQLRMKNVTDEVYLTTAKRAKEICKSYNAIFVVNDSMYVAIHSYADGVHLGKEDESPVLARKLLGTNIVGGTANTLQDCEKLIAAKVDYIGLGPFRYTETKKNLSPILGIEGYKHILAHVPDSVPVIAIGGITPLDVSALVSVGVSGIAVSGILTLDHLEQIRTNVKLIEEHAYETITNSK
ncbi:thiamine phosphate synthase [Zhouia sp. PK063]|uniref:thiamine phosphate synthase n=1 Tax=Zhouia sp. PK063 TaxID=3373602 RepID=UPI0037BDA3E7